jgi:tRNA(adenine34) deaminase
MGSAASAARPRRALVGASAGGRVDKQSLSIDRRAVMRGLATAAVPAAIAAATPASAKAIASPARPEDEGFMREAIVLAAAADFPFGAVIVRDGKIIGRGLNLGRQLKDPTAHGEMVAIRRCIGEHGPDSLKGATLYTSGEPCAMCMGAIAWCGITRLVYGASMVQLASTIDQIMIPCTEVADKTAFATIAITGGVLADEAMKLFRR